MSGSPIDDASDANASEPPRVAAGAADARGRAADVAAWLGVASLAAALPWATDDHGARDLARAAAAAGLGVVLLAFAAARGALGAPGGPFRRLLVGAVVAVAFVGTGLLGDRVLREAEARSLVLPFVQRPAAIALTALGYRPAVANGVLHVDHPDGTVSVTPSVDKTAARAFVPFAVFGVLLLGLAGGRRWPLRALAFVALSLALVALRYVAVLVAYLEQDDILVRKFPSSLTPFTDPLGVAAALAASGLLAAFLFRGPARPVVVRADGGRRRRFAWFGVVALLAVLTSALEDPGTRKPGRLLIDDRLCGYWEPAARLLDEEWYGDFATYNFNSAAEWLGQRYLVDVNVHRRYDDELLGGYDVLVVKTPIEDLAAEEIDAVHRFVDSGGGLLVVGDHTNLLGMGTRLNRLLAPYPMRFEHDSVEKASSGAFSTYEGPLLGRHPAALRVDDFQYMTSCSLHVRWPAESVMTVPDCLSDPADYANPSHFGNRLDDPSIRRGPYVLAGVCRSGRGRVGAFTDSTVWSSFDLFKNGHERLLLDMIEYLNRANLWSPAAQRLVAALLCVLAIVLFSSLCFRERLAYDAVVSVPLLALVGLAAADASHRLAYRLPEPFVDAIDVRFQWPMNECALPPVLGSNSSRAEVTFDTLFVAMQRLGARPSVAWEVEDVLEGDPEVVLVINPVDPPPPEHLAALRRHVEGGGRLVVLDRYANAGGTSAPHYLGAFGVDVTMHGGDDPHVHQEGLTPIDLGLPDAFAGVAAAGEGRVLFFVDSERFARQGIGHAFAVPWADAAANYRTIYHLFGDVLELRRDDRRFYGILP